MPEMTAQPKKSQSAELSGVLKNAGRGLNNSRIAHASIPQSHAVCEAAIECGAQRNIKVKKMKAMRSSHITVLFSRFICAMSSSRLKNFSIETRK